MDSLEIRVGEGLLALGAVVRVEVRVVEAQVDGVDAFEIEGRQCVLEAVEGHAEHLLGIGVVVVAGAVIQRQDAVGLGGGGREEDLLGVVVLHKGGGNGVLVIVGLSDGDVTVLGGIGLAGHHLKELVVEPGAVGVGDAVVLHLQVVHAHQRASLGNVGVGGSVVVVGGDVVILLLAGHESSAEGHQSHGKDSKMFFHRDRFV